MNRKNTLSLLSIVLLSVGGTAYAAQGNAENDALAIHNAKISLSQATTIAEQHVNGRASRAEYEHSKLGWVFDVEVINGSKVFDVKVDADQGKILSSAEDKVDQDDSGDKID